MNKLKEIAGSVGDSRAFRIGACVLGGAAILAGAYFAGRYFGGKSGYHRGVTDTIDTMEENGILCGCVEECTSVKDLDTEDE